MNGETSGPRTLAEALYIEFLVGLRQGSGLDLEALCRLHPAQAEEFRRIQADVARLATLDREARGYQDGASLTLLKQAAQAEEARFSEAERLLQEFLARTPGERAGGFETFVGEHGELERELRELAAGVGAVEAAFSEGQRVQAGQRAGVDELLRGLRTAEAFERRYVLEGEVGKGGMGAVLRVQDQKLGRPLAMKVILGQAAPSGETPPVAPRALRRFLDEARITSQLDHPGIVPVHELGLDESGSVYFTMKLVKGRDLKAIFDLVFDGKEGWNEARALSVILRACEALSYAHAKGVIHRDLKPANIMVGNFGEVYVMDWGLARVLGRADAHDVRLAAQPERMSSLRTERADERRGTPDSPLVTMDGAVVGTPAYMPPEQARGQVEKLSPRSDVYAVGAMLYHLLARHMPYVEPDSRISNQTVLARVLEGPPTAISRVRTGVPAELVAICEKAMAREPEQRYASTLELAEDLRAFLEHRVVGAYETGTWAETKKWVLRNKALSGAIAATLVVAIGGAVAFSVKANEAEASAELAREQSSLATHRATALAEAVRQAEENARTAEARRQEADAARADAVSQKELAERNAAETRSVADFQSRLLSDLSIDEFGHRLVVELEKDLGENMARLGKDAAEIDRAKSELDTLLRSTNPTNVAQQVLESAMFDPAVRTIETDYADRPLLAAMLETPLAATLQALSLYELAERMGRTALAARRAELGDGATDTLASIDGLASLLEERGKFAEAEQLVREALATRSKQFGTESREALESSHQLAGILHAQGRSDEAEALYREVIAGRRKQLGDEHPDTLGSINDLGALLWSLDRLEEAEPLLREALAGHRKVWGDGDINTLASLNNVALVLEDEGQLSEAETLLREALAGSRKKLGDQHPSTLTSVDNLASLLKEQGKFDEARPLLLEALAGRRDKLGNEHPDTLSSLVSVASDSLTEGRYTDAEALYREALGVQRRILGDEHPETLLLMHNLAVTLHEEHRYAEAEALYREAIAARSRILGERDPITRISISELVKLLLEQDKFAEAEPLARAELEENREALGEDDERTLDSIIRLGRLLHARGGFTEAEALFREALAGRRAIFGELHSHTLSVMDWLATTLQDQGKLAEAETVFRSEVAGRRAILGDAQPATLNAISGLANVLAEQRKSAEAESLHREALAVRREKLGSEHPDTLRSMHNLASILGADGRLQDAEALYREALAGRRKVLGDEHADTQTTVAALVSFYEAWNAREPDRGHDVQAREMRALLAAK